MNEFLKSKVLPFALGFAVVFFAVFSIAQTVSKNKLARNLLETQNELAEAIGTIELQDGVYARLASERSDLNRIYQELLGEGEILSEELDSKNERIRTLIQTNARLREDIEFVGNATTTVVAGCDDNPNDGGTGTTTDPENPIGPEEFVPNLRVDFLLESGGFMVDGFTESNPSLVLGQPEGRVELTLSQIDPFVVDIAVTETDDNGWRAILYEQERRLEFDVGVLTVNPRNSKIRWYERIGVGSQLAITESGFGLAPNLSLRLGQRGAWDLNAGPYWGFGEGDVQRGVSVGVSVFPFSRRRRSR